MFVIQTNIHFPGKFQATTSVLVHPTKQSLEAASVIEHATGSADGVPIRFLIMKHVKQNNVFFMMKSLLGNHQRPGASYQTEPRSGISDRTRYRLSCWCTHPLPDNETCETEL